MSCVWLVIFTTCWLLLILSSKAQAQKQWIAPPPGMSDTRNCPECDAGEWRLIIEKEVEPGNYVYVPDPPCNTTSIDNQRHEIARALANYAEPGLGEAAGPLIDAVSDQTATWVKQNIRGSIGEYLASYSNPTAQCQLVCGIVPKDSTITGMKYWADDDIANQQTCSPAPDQNIYCGIHWSKFLPAYTEEQASGKAACAIFANWSDNRVRGATLGIYFKPAPGKTPIPIHR